MIYSIIALIIGLIALVIYFKFKRNYFNKFQYVRLVTYNKDMTVKVSYIKRKDFNTDNSILINEKHVYNFKGYTTIIKTDTCQESINPLDFKSKFNSEHYKTAIRTKLISETFNSLKKDKFDKIMALLMLNGFQLLAIMYLIYMLLEV